MTTAILSAAEHALMATPAFRSFRVVEGLQEAAQCDPSSMPEATSAAARKGKAYERKVIRQLSSHGEIWHEPWFRFVDRHGMRHCVPDAVIPLPKMQVHLVCEVKLTFVPEAIYKLQHLYVPVLRKALHTPILPLVICRNLGSWQQSTAVSVRTAIETAHMGGVPVLQWLGHGKIDW